MTGDCTLERLAIALAHLEEIDSEEPEYNHVLNAKEQIDNAIRANL